MHLPKIVKVTCPACQQDIVLQAHGRLINHHPDRTNSHGLDAKKPCPASEWSPENYKAMVDAQKRARQLQADERQQMMQTVIRPIRIKPGR